MMMMKMKLLMKLMMMTDRMGPTAMLFNIKQ